MAQRLRGLATRTVNLSSITGTDQITDSNSRSPAAYSGPLRPLRPAPAPVPAPARLPAPCSGTRGWETVPSGPGKATRETLQREGARRDRLGLRACPTAADRPLPRPRSGPAARAAPGALAEPGARPSPQMRSRVLQQPLRSPSSPPVPRDRETSARVSRDLRKRPVKNQIRAPQACPEDKLTSCQGTGNQSEPGRLSRRALFQRH